MKIEKCKIGNSLTKYFVKVYGCQYNEWDAARIKFMLDRFGFAESSEKDADFIIITACAVRKSAVDRMLGKIHNWQNKKVVVTGCILNNDRKRLEKNNVFYWDNKKPEELKNILHQCYSTLFEQDLESCKILKRDADPASGAGRLASVQDDNISELLSLGNPESAYLPIMTGCNNFCSYCAVPYTRGRETSRPIEEVISDFKKLVANGNKEIMLLGQNVNSYNPVVISTHREPTVGWIERDEKSHNEQNKSHLNVIPAKAAILKIPDQVRDDSVKSFTILLHELNAIPGDFIISFTSNHPKDMTDDIIGAVRDLPKIKKEIHLPFQSGSDKVLRLMNRPYTRKQYLALIDKIRKIIPNVNITTDVIVGFPGETEEEFEQTVDAFRKIKFDAAYVNKYSPREGTAAFKLGDPVPWEEKERRWRILNDISYHKK